jgi:trafficking protein particle complex subunit 3
VRAHCPVVPRAETSEVFSSPRSEVFKELEYDTASLVDAYLKVNEYLGVVLAHLILMKHVISTELFTLTYGEIVSQVVKDCEDLPQANDALKLIGKNIGSRLVDEYFAKEKSSRPCRSHKETIEVIATKALPYFIGVSAKVEDYSEAIEKKEGRKFQVISSKLSIEDNLILANVELPAFLSVLEYQNILSGGLEGCLETLGYEARSQVLADSLKNGGKASVFGL